jgi:hypothetical protein
VPGLVGPGISLLEPMSSLILREMRNREYERFTDVWDQDQWSELKISGQTFKVLCKIKAPMALDSANRIKKKTFFILPLSKRSFVSGKTSNDARSLLYTRNLY